LSLAKDSDPRNTSGGIRNIIIDVRYDCASPIGQVDELPYRARKLHQTLRPIVARRSQHTGQKAVQGYLRAAVMTKSSILDQVSPVASRRFNNQEVTLRNDLVQLFPVVIPGRGDRKAARRFMLISVVGIHEDAQSAWSLS
jgi:hypothetical protein